MGRRPARPERYFSLVDTAYRASLLGELAWRPVALSIVHDEPPALPTRSVTTRREGLRISLCGLFGVALVAFVVNRSDVSVAVALQIAGITGLAVLAATVGGVGVLYLARRRSIGTQAGLLALIAVSGAALGAWGTARAMFLSRHDFAVLIVVLVTAAVAAALGAMALGRRINAVAEDLIEATRLLDGTGAVVVPRGGHPTELARLAVELNETSMRLRDAQLRAQALENSKRELVAWISGDLLELVAHVNELVGRLDPSHVAELHDEIDRIGSIVHDLLELNGVPQEIRKPAVENSDAG